MKRPHISLGAAVALVVIVLSGAYLVFAGVSGQWPFGTEQQTPPPTGVVYRNTHYGLQVALPDSWKGYTVISSSYDIFNISTGAHEGTGVIIKLRNPLWTAPAPYEDLPVMVFTPANWQRVLNEQISVGAAPIPPSLLARNSVYVFALPARYNYDFATGWQEVQQVIDSGAVTAFEPVSTVRSGISGLVMVGPTCPVQRVGDMCADKPYQGQFTVKNNSGVQVATFTTDANGYFLVSLPAGTYTILPVKRIGISEQPKVVTVKDGKVTTVVLTFDTGIR